MHDSALRFTKPRSKKSALRSESDGPPTRRAPAEKTIPKNSIPSDRLPGLISAWIDDGEWRGHSAATRRLHREIADNLLWFLQERSLPSCGTDELRAFLTYLRAAHAEEGGLWHGVPDPPGRWGNPQMTRKVRPSTVHTYHSRLKTFFRWLVHQDYLEISPMAKLDAPVNRSDQIETFASAQILALAAAARCSQSPLRDETIVWLLFDTGVRADELCGLRRGDLDLTEKRVRVLGKGGKERSIYFGRFATKSLWAYLRDFDLASDEPLFPSESGPNKGGRLCARSLGDMIERLGKRANIQGVRCSPHTFRHTHAIEYLRGGGTIEGLKERLGHEDLKMTLRYVKLAEADLEGQRRHSPADRLARSLGPGQGAARGGKTPVKSSLPDQALGASPASSGPPPTQTKKITKAKLGEDDVRAIKRRLAGRMEGSGESLAQIAADYGVARSTIKDIAMGYTWRHIHSGAQMD